MLHLCLLFRQPPCKIINVLANALGQETVLVTVSNITRKVIEVTGILISCFVLLEGCQQAPAII
jgi:hypothetical protein